MNRKKIASDIIVAVMGGVIAILGAGVIRDYINRENYLSYENSNYGIQLEYPKKWSVQEKLNTLQPEVKLVSPLENNPDNFQERVTVEIETLSKALSLERYTAQATAQIETANTIIEPAKETNFANKEGREIIYQEKNGDKKRMQVWMLKNKNVYIATYTAEADKFNKFSKQADKIIESLAIDN